MGGSKRKKNNSGSKNNWRRERERERERGREREREREIINHDKAILCIVYKKLTKLKIITK